MAQVWAKGWVGETVQARGEEKVLGLVEVWAEE